MAEDDVKVVPERYSDAHPLSSFVGIMSEMALTRNSERLNVRLCGSGSASGARSMVSRVMAVIVSKKPR